MFPPMSRPFIKSSVRQLWLGLVAGAVVALVMALPANGAVRIGAPMNLPVDMPGAEGCEAMVLPPLRATMGVPPSCTLMSPITPGGGTSQTPRGHWVVVSARVRTGPRTGPMVFSVVRVMRSQAGGVTNPSGAICCVVPFESQVFTPPPNSVFTVPVRLPVRNTVEPVEGERIEIVDYLGITPLTLQSTLPLRVGSGGTGALSFAPGIRAGGQALAGPTLPGFAVIDGVYEPDANRDGFGDESQAVCTGARTNARSHQVNCPPANNGARVLPRITVRPVVQRQTVAQVNRQGVLRVRCTTSVAGRCGVVATVNRATARRLGLPARSATVKIGQGTVRTTRGGRVHTVVIRLTRPARQSIGRSRQNVPVRLVVTGASPGHRSHTVVRNIGIWR